MIELFEDKWYTASGSERWRQPGKIGTLELPHRLLMGSMHLGLEASSEHLPRLIAFYVERVRGQAALIITGGVAVSREGSSHRMFCLLEEEHAAMLQKLAGAVHEAGGRIAMQLFHSGRYAHSAETGEAAVAPSPVASRLTGEMPRELSVEDILHLVGRYAAAAVKARQLGYDAIEIMGSEGYLLNQFLSPLTNHREDDYGGSAEKRRKFPLDVVKGIRAAVGSDFPIIFRMSGVDLMAGSTTLEETYDLAVALEEAGVDALNIGVGWHESTVPTVAAVVPRAAFSPIVAAIRQHVQVPVIAANRMNVPEAFQPLFESGQVDFVAAARPWLADAEFGRKVLEGRRSQMNVCIACNQSCLDHTLVRPLIPASCLVNPRAGFEAERPLSKADVALRVAVLGGGPAGLEAARVAALRGHAVTLFEAAAELGGQFRYAARIPDKEEFYETLRYYRVMLAELGVDVRLETEPTAADLQGFQSILVATGVRPHIPDLPGTELPHVRTYVDILTQGFADAQEIVLVGAGGIACDVAKYITERVRPNAAVNQFLTDIGAPLTSVHRPNVTMVARSKRVASGVGRTTRWIVRSELTASGVRILTECRPVEIVPGGLRVQGQGVTEATLIGADLVVLCTGQRPQQAVLQELGDDPRVLCIGGARDSAGLTAARAIREGFDAAYRLGQETAEDGQAV